MKAHKFILAARSFTFMETLQAGDGVKALDKFYIGSMTNYVLWEMIIWFLYFNKINGFQSISLHLSKLTHEVKKIYCFACLVSSY